MFLETKRHARVSGEPPLRDLLLLKRDIISEKAKEDFLYPNRRQFHNPLLLSGVSRAAERIQSGIARSEHIVVWSDYDTDGIPAAVMWHDFFTDLGYTNFSIHIPHRHEEGFGLNREWIARYREKGATLLITADCGITDVNEVDAAHECGIDVIITDHHLPGDALPRAYVLVNPQIPGDHYPNKHICGAGVTYKLLEVLSQNCDTLPKGWVEKELDMLALATLSDMVPLLGENRAFAHFGLIHLRRTTRVGLRELARQARLDVRTLTEDDVAFTIAPRINAASRMDHPEHAFVLLSTRDSEEARDRAELLTRLNDERKGHVAAMVKEIHTRMEVMSDQDVIVMGNPNWKPGIVGLAAHAIVERYGKTAFIWGREGSPTIKGSCRSNGDIDLVELMASAKDAFLDYGGHSGSGGFSISTEAIHTLSDVLNAAYREMPKKETVSAGYIDAELSLDDVSWTTYAAIEQLAPFGVGNPKPVFVFSNVVPQSVKKFGKERNHLELVFNNSLGISIKAIAFFKTPTSFGREISTATPLKLFASLERSTFGKVPELRLRIVDIV